MTTNSINDTQPAPSERDKLQMLRSKMIDRALKMIDDPDLPASGFAALVKFLAEQGITTPAAPPKPIPANSLPFGADDRPSKMPFPADTDEQKPGWKPLDSAPFITA